MLTFIAIIHVIVAVLIIFFVLIQDSKGGAMGMLGGGGGGNTVFGSSGAGGFLVKATTVLAIVFSLTCIVLVKRSQDSGPSVVDGYVPPTSSEAAPTGATPEEASTEKTEDAK